MTMELGHWEHFPHEADVGLCGFGPTRAAAFAQVGLALTAVITDPALVRAAEGLEVTRTAEDPEMLLVEWVDALIYEMTVRRMLFGQFVVEMDSTGTQLRARAVGEPLDPARHQPAVEPKGATFTALRVAPCPGGGWLAQCVVDV